MCLSARFTLRFFLFALVCGAVATSAVRAAPLQVVYPAYEAAGDTRFEDLIELLRTALQRTEPKYGPFELKPSRVPMNEARYLGDLASPLRTVNVAWSSTSEEMEKNFLAIRIPLRRGLIGYRIALIEKGRQEAFDRVKTLDDLRRLSVGQGIGWGDVQLLRQQGFKVTAASYEDLFGMVARGRFDFFPRGVNEVFDEFAVRSKEHPQIAIEKRLMLHYPWPYYFFFNKQDVALRDRVEAGLRMMIRDGTFEALFYRRFGKAIERADFANRHVIRVTNDMLPKDTPLHDPALWFDPQRDKAARAR